MFYFACFFIVFQNRGGESNMASGYYYECDNCEWQGILNDPYGNCCPECGEEVYPDEDACTNE